MFDIVKIECDLPDGHKPKKDEEYQTKDTDEQYLRTYTLTKNGRLFLDGVDTNFHGDLRFYTSNISGGSCAGVITSDNKKPISREYVALFKDGKMIDLRGGITDTHRGVKHYKDRDKWWADTEKKHLANKKEFH